MLIATTRTGLGSVPWIYFGDHRTTSHSLVLSKAMQLSKRPTMEPSFCVNGPPLLATSDLGSGANVGQILKHDGGALWRKLNDPLGEDMIVIFSLAKQFSTQFAQMALCRSGAFCLELSTDAEKTPL